MCAKQMSTRTDQPGMRSGSAYVMVLTLAMLLTVIGLSAITSARVGLRNQQMDADGADATILAESAIEWGLYQMAASDTWRIDHDSGVWSSPIALGRGTIEYMIVDEDDAMLSDDPSDAVRLYGRATIDSTVRILSVAIDPDENDAPEEIITNGDMESGLGPWTQFGDVCVPESTTTDPYAGSRAVHIRNRSSASAGVSQDLTGKVESGETYNTDLWVNMKDFSDSMVFFGLRVTMNGGATHTFVDVGTADTSWTNLTGQITPTWSGNVSKIEFYILPSSSNQEFYIDDASVMSSGSSGETLQHRPIPGTWRREITSDLTAIPEGS